MKYLLDTHTLIWGLYDSSELSPKVIQIMSEESCYISIASFWEMAIKSSLGKLDLSQSINDISLICRKYGIGIVQIKPVHCQMVRNMPFIHKDPFDRMLIAQAQTERLTILTKDTFIPQYDVATIW